MKKKYYPPIIKWAYATGNENELISVNEQLLIPKQSKSNWRKLHPSDIQLLEEELKIKEKLDVLLVNKDLNWFTKKKLFRSITRMNFKIIDSMGKNKYIKTVAGGKSEFVKLIEEFSLAIPKNDLLKWFRVNPHQYHIWHTQVYYKCQSSKLKLCAKKHPFQITEKEYKIIESYLLDPFYTAWPKSAIHSTLIVQGKISISRSTFYKHAHNILPEKERIKSRKPKFKPLRANYINEYWHMDISYFSTQNNQRSFIYAIIDNYSRKIIAWKCEPTISKHFVGEIIIEAMQTVSVKKLNLVSDGGTENVNTYIEQLILNFHLQKDISIDHKVALKTIRQSNSMIERFFRTMKSQYLYFNVPYTHIELCIALEKIIHEYNHIRPHYALNHLTPGEAYEGKQGPDLELQLKKAKKKRYKVNINCPCTECNCQL